jgi:hypothetical protein
MSQINKSLLNWVLSIEDDEKIYVDTYGSFSMDRMDFDIFIDDAESEKFDRAEKLIIENDGIAPSEEIAHDYYKPIQVYNHELFHYYQAFTLPAFRVYQQITKRKTEFEAATMLRFFEYGNYYIIGKDKKIFDVLNKKDFNLPSDEEINFNKLNTKYKFFREQWTAKYKNISLFYIIEGMAHIMSIQLTPYSKNYLKYAEDKIEYNIAYDVFDSYIDTQYNNIEIRIKHLIFLNICYFTCQTYSLEEDEILEKSSRVFYTLCSRINLYFKTFITFIERYVDYSEFELKQLNQFDIHTEDIEKSNKNQLCNIYALFELIPCIEQDAKKFYNLKVYTSLDVDKEILEIFESLKIDLTNIYQLTNFALFPTRMADMWESYDIIQKIKIEDNNFSFTDESAFYELISSCKKLLKRKLSLIPCCEEHGTIDNKFDILDCDNEGSLAFYLKELTQRKATDLFRIRR